MKFILAKLCQVGIIASLIGGACAAPPQLGDVNPVAGCRYQLSGSGISSSDTSITLTSFTECISGNELSMSDFGTIGYATIEPGSQTGKEFVSFTGITQDSNSTRATLTGVSRGLMFTTPYTASSSLAKSHSGGVIFIISNPPQLFNTYISKYNDSRVSSTVTFSNTKIPRLDSSHTYGAGEEEYLATKRYVDSVATSGAPDASLTAKGLVEIATPSESAAGSTTGDTTAPLVLPNSRVNATSTATTTVPATKANGKLSQTFYDLTEPWAFTGGVSSNSSTFTGIVNDSSTYTQSGTAIFNGTITGSAFFPGVKVSASTTDVTVSATTTETNLISTTIPANTIGTSSIVRGTAYLKNLNTNLSTDTFVFRLKYGGTQLTSTTLLCAGYPAGQGCNGQIDFSIFGAGTTSSQEAIMRSSFAVATSSIYFSSTAPYGSSTAATSFVDGTSAVDSTSAQTLLLTVANSTNSANQSITLTRYEVWKERP